MVEWPTQITLGFGIARCSLHTSQAGGRAAPQGGPGSKRRDPYLAHILPLRGRLIEGELRQRQFERSQLILERWRDEGEAVGEIDFYLGELHRERSEAGDTAEALDHYRRATEDDGAPPETWRSIGWVERRRGDDARAREAFARYLELEPEARDRALIEAWMAQSR